MECGENILDNQKDIGVKIACMEKCNNVPDTLTNRVFGAGEPSILKVIQEARQLAQRNDITLQ